eukprot:442013_1
MSEQAPSWWSGNALSYAQKKGSAEMKKLNYKRFKASGAVLGFAVFGIFMRLKSETQVQLDLEAEKLSKANADYRRAVSPGSIPQRKFTRDSPRAGHRKLTPTKMAVSTSLSFSCALRSAPSARSLFRKIRIHLPKV